MQLVRAMLHKETDGPYFTIGCLIKCYPNIAWNLITSGKSRSKLIAPVIRCLHNGHIVVLRASLVNWAQQYNKTHVKNPVYISVLDEAQPKLDAIRKIRTIKKYHRSGHVVSNMVYAHA